MKKTINLLGLVLLAAIAGYGAYWYVLTNQAETQFVTQLNDWQSKNPNEKFTYDSISKEGFPGHIKLRIENPHFTHKDESGNFEAHLKGFLTLSRSLWNNERSVETQGESTVSLPPLNNEVPNPAKISWKGYNVLTLESDKTGHFEIFKQLLSKEDNDDEEVSFKSWASKLDEYHFSGDIDKDTPLEINGGAIDSKVFVRNYKKDQQEFVFNLAQKDLTINTPANRAILSTFLYSPSDLGKISFNLDGSLCYPDPDTLEKFASFPLSPKQAEACIKVDRFNFTSDLMNSSTQNGVLSLQQDGNKWTFTFKVASEGSYTKKYDEVIKKSFAILLKDPEFLKQYVGDDKQAQQKIIDAAPQIVELLPNGSTFGTINAKIDLLANAEINDNSVDFGSIDLRTLDYNVPPYNLNLAGKFNFKKDFTDMAGGGSFKITRYKQLIEQLTNYANKIVAVYNDASKEAPIPSVKPDDVKKVLTFLRAVSDDPNKDGSDLRVTFSYNDNDSWKVGTLPMPDFLEKAMTLYTSLIPTAVPAPHQAADGADTEAE